MAVGAQHIANGQPDAFLGQPQEQHFRPCPALRLDHDLAVGVLLVVLLADHEGELDPWHLLA